MLTYERFTVCKSEYHCHTAAEGGTIAVRIAAVVRHRYLACPGLIDPNPVGAMARARTRTRAHI